MRIPEDAQRTISFLVDNLHLHDVNALSCGWHRRGKKQWTGPLVRDYFELHYILSGCGFFVCDKQTYHLKKYDMFLIRSEKWVYYEADGETPWTYAWIGFEGDAVERMLQIAGFVGDRLTASLPEMYDFFSALPQHNSFEPVSSIELCSVLFSIFSQLQRKQVPASSLSMPALYIRRATEYIHANYSQPLTIEGLAQLMGIGRQYFSRIFTESVGVSPQAYLVNYRLEKAAALLAEHHCTVSDAAKSVGYTDPFTFSRMYKKRYGIPPITTLTGGRG